MNLKQLALELGLEQEEFSELLTLFIETSESDLLKIQEGINNGETDQVADAAHSIKGASANLGFMDISSDAKSIEQAAHNNHLEDLIENIKKIRERLALISEALGGYHLRDSQK
jgi:HPt (histidine-containing phosphotransfer) domain-containing protein